MSSYLCLCDCPLTLSPSSFSVLRCLVTCISSTCPFDWLFLHASFLSVAPLYLSLSLHKRSCGHTPSSSPHHPLRLPISLCPCGGLSHRDCFSIQHFLSFACLRVSQLLSYVSFPASLSQSSLSLSFIYLSAVKQQSKASFSPSHLFLSADAMVAHLLHRLIIRIASAPYSACLLSSLGPYHQCKTEEAFRFRSSLGFLNALCCSLHPHSNSTFSSRRCHGR